MLNKQLTRWGSVLMLVVASSTAWAIGNSNQKGSLLIFPRIDVTANKNTIISITNDSGATYVHCYYLGANKDRLDFEFSLTLQDMENFSVSPADFPGTVKKGALVCWAEQPTSVGGADYVPISHNHLFGKATVIDSAAGTAYEYRAWAFKALSAAEQPVSSPGNLVLDGSPGGAGSSANYEACPMTLLGEFFGHDRSFVNPDNGVVLVAPPTRTLLTVASCTQDLRQDTTFIATKLEFDVFGDFEHKFTNAWECSDSWHETYLGEPNTPATSSDFPAVWTNGKEQLEANAGLFITATNFSNSISGLGWYRVYTSNKTNCVATLKPVNSDPTKNTKVNPIPVGLVGVQVTELTNGANTTASDLSMSGTMNGSILYTPNTGQFEKR